MFQSLHIAGDSTDVAVNASAVAIATALRPGEDDPEEGKSVYFLGDYFALNEHQIAAALRRMCSLPGTFAFFFLLSSWQWHGTCPAGFGFGFADEWIACRVVRPNLGGFDSITIDSQSQMPAGCVVSQPM